MDTTSSGRVLRICFSEAEWNYLRQHPEFLQMAEGIKTIEDLERTIVSGGRFLEEKFGPRPIGSTTWQRHIT